MFSSRVSHGVAIASEWSPAEIDVLCDAFEDAYRRGEEPRIRDYIDQCEGPPRAALFAELMQVELELRQESGSQRSYEQYLTSFPEFSDVIETIAFKYGLTTESTPRAPREAPPGHRAERDGYHGRIAHFQLQQKLGAGGMGEVWRAWDSRLKRTVAIKFPRNRQLNEQDLHRFLREGRAAAQLRHSHIVSVHEVGRDGDIAYIVSDFIAGQSLQQLLDSHAGGKARASDGTVSGRALAPGDSEFESVTKPRAASAVPLADYAFTPHRAAELCAQLADALHHAHQHGIVHRDLKPSNILLSTDGNTHVVDFGIAKWADDTVQLTLDGFALGTPAYMSPEQARGDSAHVDRRADVYALGALLYTMLTGKAPFVGDSQEAVLRAVLIDTPPQPRSLRRDIPRDLETICLKAMEQVPARRYATAGALAADLARFMRGDPILGRRPSVLEKSVRLVRKRPALAAAVVLGFFAVTIGGLAGVLARENQALKEGLVTVNLQTNPPGARVVFVPLDVATQEPQGDKAVYPGTRSPVNVDLKPGDYLVVAAMDGGRFHEVFRHVPKDRSEMITVNRHQHWEWKDEEVVLPPIDIPELAVTRGMALIELNRDRGEAGKRKPHSDAFFMDVRELTYRDCPKCFEPLSVEKHRLAAIKMDQAITDSFDRACQFAEIMGKRLPTAVEFERAAALPRQSKCDGTEPDPKEFGLAGTPACDRVGRDMQIAGLYSNVAEWTTTVFTPADGVKPEIRHVAGRPIPFLLNVLRVIKGGDESVVEGNPTLAAEHRDPASAYGLQRFRTKPGLGLRCVRSASPRFLKDEQGK